MELKFASDGDSNWWACVESDNDPSGTYVLASDANERIKALEDALKNLVQAVDILNSIRPDDPYSKIEK